VLLVPCETDDELALTGYHLLSESDNYTDFLINLTAAAMTILHESDGNDVGFSINLKVATAMSCSYSPQ
jgi:hypothetical protein